MPHDATRRSFALGALAGAAAAVIAPRLAFADAKAVAAEIAALYGDRAPAAGRIKLDLAQIAENGLAVPIGVEVESPMTDADYVRSVHVFADGNPAPSVVSFAFTPDCGRAAAATRMRLAQSQNIIVVAEMSDGRLFSHRQDVKVTVGGCAS